MNKYLFCLLFFLVSCTINNPVKKHVIYEEYMIINETDTVSLPNFLSEKFSRPFISIENNKVKGFYLVKENDSIFNFRYDIQKDWNPYDSIISKVKLIESSVIENNQYILFDDNPMPVYELKPSDSTLYLSIKILKDIPFAQLSYKRTTDLDTIVVTKMRMK